MALKLFIFFGDASCRCGMTWRARHTGREKKPKVPLRIGIGQARLRVPGPPASDSARPRRAPSMASTREPSKGSRPFHLPNPPPESALLLPNPPFGAAQAAFLTLSFWARRCSRYFLMSAFGRSLCFAQTIPKTGAARFEQPGTGQS